MTLPETHIGIQNTVSGWKAVQYELDEGVEWPVPVQFGLIGHGSPESAQMDGHEWAQSTGLPLLIEVLGRFWVRYTYPDGKETMDILSVKDEDGKWINLTEETN
jgi:hypothetical protein